MKKKIHIKIQIRIIEYFSEFTYHQRSSGIAFARILAAFSVSCTNHFRPYFNLKSKVFHLLHKTSHKMTEKREIPSWFQARAKFHRGSERAPNSIVVPSACARAINRY